MVRAVVWKEFREQGLIALTLLVLGSALQIAAATLGDPAAGGNPNELFRYFGAGRLATLLLAVTAGMVCGGALFAAERECGTMAFLDALPATRWQLWRAKMAAGLALAGGQIAVVIGVSFGLGLMTNPVWGLELFLYALQAFAWGAFGSAVLRTTLGAVGVAFPTAAVAAFLYLVPILLLFSGPGINFSRPDGPVRVEGQLLYLVLMFLTPVGLSAFTFTRPDRDRAADDPFTEPHFRKTADVRPAATASESVFRGPWRFFIGLKALVWLATRQAVVPVLVTSAFALVFGLTLLLPDVHPGLIWPALALTAGVFAGVTAFADEQAHGSSLYWGERRLPVGRAWAVKIAVHALFALGLVFLLIAPLLVRGQVAGSSGTRGQTILATTFHSLLFDELDPQGWKYVLAPAAYGFAAGHLAGLLFRKLVVAAGVAGLVGGTALALWLPSLLAGGLAHGQLWAPPLAVLATARLLIRPWAAERLLTRKPLRTLAAGLGGVTILLAAGLAYRVGELPDDPDGEDDVRYVRALPPFDDNPTGRDFRTAAERFARVSAAITPGFDQRPVPPGVRRSGRIEERAEGAMYRGWRADDPDLAAWLNQLYDSDRPVAPDDRAWHALVVEAAARPLGMYEDPRLMSLTSRDPALESARKMAVALIARGLQRQAAGDAGELVRNLSTVFALGRSVGDRSVVSALFVGQGITRSGLAGTDEWLKAQDGPADQLRAAIRVLQGDEPGGPFDPTPHMLAERYILREAMKAPNQWLPNFIKPRDRDQEAVAVEVDVVTFAWTVPWEQERTRRLIGLRYETGLDRPRAMLVRGRPGSHYWFTSPRVSPDALIEVDR